MVLKQTAPIGRLSIPNVFIFCSFLRFRSCVSRLFVCDRQNKTRLGRFSEAVIGGGHGEQTHLQTNLIREMNLKLEFGWRRKGRIKGWNENGDKKKQYSKDHKKKWEKHLRRLCKMCLKRFSMFIYEHKYTHTYIYHYECIVYIYMEYIGKLMNMGQKWKWFQKGSEVSTFETKVCMKLFGGSLLAISAFNEMVKELEENCRKKRGHTHTHNEW